MSGRYSYDRREGFTNPYAQNIKDLTAMANLMEADIKTMEKREKERDDFANDTLDVVGLLLDSLRKYPLPPAESQSFTQDLAKLQREIARAGASSMSWPDVGEVLKVIREVKDVTRRTIRPGPKLMKQLLRAEKEAQALYKKRLDIMRSQDDNNYDEVERLYKGLIFRVPETDEEMDVNEALRDIWEEYLKDEPKWRRIDILVNGALDTLQIGNPAQLSMFASIAQRVAQRAQLS